MKLSKDIISGVLFLLVAGAFGYQSFALSMGMETQMGPGAFPLLLCGVLALLGVGVIVGALREKSRDVERFSLRGPLTIVVATVLFGVLVKPLGFIATLAIVTLIASTAGKTFDPLLSVVLTVAVVAASWLIFIVGLGLPYPLVGPWLGGH
jgi:putative tricarboxylic transport membrane protein